MQEEWNVIEKNETWELVDRPLNLHTRNLSGLNGFTEPNLSLIVF